MKNDFRGQIKNDKIWIYGEHKYDYELRNNCISVLKEGNKCEVFNVKEETLCQYTGLRDKNNIKIYENDVCNFNYNDICHRKGIVKFHNGGFIIVWQYCTGRFGQLTTYSANLDKIKNIEVLGDIYNDYKYENEKLNGIEINGIKLKNGFMTKF